MSNFIGQTPNIDELERERIEEDSQGKYLLDTNL
jgi:hypothetical protein